MDELAGVGAYVEHEVDGELGEEELVAELLRGVDTGLPDLEARGFGEGAQGVFEMGIHSPQFSVLSSQFSVLRSGDRRSLLRERCLRGEEDGEHGHEPEWEGEVEVLGVGEAADQGEEEKAGGESFEVGGIGAANLTEEYPVEGDGKKDSDGSEGEELLEKFVVSLLCFKFANGRDDEPVGVEAISEKRLFERVFEGDCPDEDSAGQGLRACSFGVGRQVGFEKAPECG